MKKVHLMFESTPFSVCGMYLGDHSEMKQTFKFSKVTCKKCVRVMRKTIEGLVKK